MCMFSDLLKEFFNADALEGACFYVSFRFSTSDPFFVNFLLMQSVKLVYFVAH
jgi:hypothetical protein